VAFCAFMVSYGFYAWPKLYHIFSISSLANSFFCGQIYLSSVGDVLFMTKIPSSNWSHHSFIPTWGSIITLGFGLSDS